MNQVKRISNALSLPLIGSIILATVAIGIANWATSPVNSQAKEKILITISRGEPIDTIGKDLTRQKLIRSPAAFKLLVIVKGLSKRIQAGDYELSKTMSLLVIVNTLTHGTSDIRITLIEGWRREEMADALQAQFEARSLRFDRQEFLRVTEGKEGYLFPDTYFIPTSLDPSDIAEIFIETFTNKVSQDIRNSVTQQGLTLEQAVILASLVEREARFSQDLPLVAGILIKRWKNQWPIQVDATVQYALGYQTKEKSWWKRSLTKADIEMDSPFNTYKHIGLPPSPICNPSLAAIEAITQPSASEFWFYISDNQGQLHYAKTIEEHNQNITKYLNK